MGKFVSLKDDVSFKYLFLNETVRLHFISDALGIPPEDIRSVRLANTFYGEDISGKNRVYWTY